MTNEEAIEVLAQDLPCETDEDLVEAMAMAIKALETVSCIKEKCAYCPHCENCDVDDETLEIKALEQQPCEDWYDVPSNEMTLEQARQAVKDLRKKLAEYLEQQTCEDAISRKDMLAIFSQSHSLTQAWDGFEKLPSVTPKSKSESEHDHEVVKAYNDGQAYILDKIRAEIERLQKEQSNHYGNEIETAKYDSYDDCLDVIDKYREVSE